MVKFSLPKLSYAYDALEPSIDFETMEIHHTKHHQTYVNNLNQLSSAVPVDSKLHQLLAGLLSVEDSFSPEDKEILKNHGGGHYNHSLFWHFMSKDSDVKDISNFLKERIEKDFGSLENLKEQFDQEALKVFGSGWAWWVYDFEQKKSYLTNTKDQMNPIMLNPNLVCLLGLDVWEHAYYLKYQNKRKDYVHNFWKVVNWKIVSLINDKIILNGKFLEISDDGYLLINQ